MYDALTTKSQFDASRWEKASPTSSIPVIAYDIEIQFELGFLSFFSIENTQDADTHTGTRTHTHTHIQTPTPTRILIRIENVRTQHWGLKSPQIITED